MPAAAGRGRLAPSGHYCGIVSSEGEAGDEFGFQPPPPEERSWRHPSEIGGADRPARPVSLVTSLSTNERRDSPAGRTAIVSLVSALVGAVLTLAVITMTGGFNPEQPGPAGVEKHEVNVARRAMSPVEIAERVIPSVARIDVVGAGGPVAGTAVVFRSNAQSGYLITTADLLDGPEKISVTIGDGPSMPAQLVGRDTKSDIAVVRVDAPNLSTVVLGRPASKLNFGDPVIAVESSAESSSTRGANTVPSGIVNGLGERLASDNQSSPTLYGMIKTNLRLTSQATGTPLIDATNGSVIGIITSRGYRAPAAPNKPSESSIQAVRGQAPSPAGMADEAIVRFATPIDYANTVADLLIKDGRVPHAWLGVNGNSLTDEEAKRFGVKGGYRITNIENTSPASDALLEVGDVLLSLDDAPIAALDDLEIALREHRPGDYVTIFYLRNGDRQPTYATLTERNPNG